MVVTYRWGHWTMLAKHAECDILLQLSFSKNQEESMRKILEMEFLKSLYGYTFM